MKDTWQSGNAYDYFMGRWSKQVAVKFLDWLAPDPNLTWVDIGCGTGVLSESIIDQCSPKRVIAIDQSEGFVQTARQRLGQRAVCKVGDALSLPLDNDSTDLSVSALVLNFFPDPVKALDEMKRVTRSSGAVAAYIWDYAGKMEFLKTFWDAAIIIDTQSESLHESHRMSVQTTWKHCFVRRISIRL